MKTFLTTIILILMTSFNINHSNYVNINGVVVDDITKERLSGVSVSFNGINAYTDFNGEFYFKTGKDELNNIKTSYISYVDYNKNIKIEKDTNIIINVHSH